MRAAELRIKALEIARVRDPHTDDYSHGQTWLDGAIAACEALLVTRDHVCDPHDPGGGTWLAVSAQLISDTIHHAREAKKP